MSSLDLGTLTVKMAADIGQLKADFAKAQAETAKTAAEAEKLSAKFSKAASMAFGAFDGIGGKIAGVASKANILGESFSKIFGQNALGPAKKLAAEIERITGISDDKWRGMAESLKTVSATMSAVAVAAGAVSLPILAAVAAAGALAAGAIYVAKNWDTVAAKFEKITRFAMAWTKLPKALGGMGLSDKQFDAAVGAAGSGARAFASDASKWIDDAKAQMLALVDKYVPSGSSRATVEKPAGMSSEMKDRIARLQEMARAELNAEMAARDYAEAQRQVAAEMQRASTAAEGIAYEMPKFSAEVESLQQQIRERDNRYTVAGDILQNNSGALGTMFGAAKAGAIGGVWGSITAAAAQLLAQSKVFVKAIEMAGSVFKAITDGLDWLVGWMFPSVEAADVKLVETAGLRATADLTAAEAAQSVADAMMSAANAAQESQNALKAFEPVMALQAEIAGLEQARQRSIEKLIASGVAPDVAASAAGTSYGYAIDRKRAEYEQQRGEAGARASGMAGTAADYRATIEAAIASGNRGRAEMFLQGLEEQVAAAQSLYAQWDDPATKAGYEKAKAELDAAQSAYDLAYAQEKAAKAAEKFSESLTNLPTGFKLAAARYGAMDAETGVVVPSAARPDGAAKVRETAARIVNLAVNIQGSDPVEIWRAIKRLMERDGFVSSGSIVPAGPLAATEG